MQTRRRVPNLFSLSMVDVLCCALGCVILLWLVNSREARHNGEKAGQSKSQLDKTALELAQMIDERDQVKDQLKDASGKLTSTQAALSQAKSETAKLQADIAALLNVKKDLLAQVKTKDATNTDLNKQVASLDEQLKSLQELLTNKELALKKANENWLAAKDLAKLLGDKLGDADKRAKNLTDQLGLSEKQAKDLLAKLGLTEEQLKKKTGEITESDLAMAKLLADARESKTLIEQLRNLVKSYKDKADTTADKLAESQGKVADLNKDLEKKKIKLDDLLRDLQEVAKLKKDLEEVAKLKAALEEQLKNSNLNLDKVNVDLAQLKMEKLELLLKAAKAKEESANRFAGIELTGKKVIFLVDTSGSMGMLDSKNADEKKWPTVCDIIGKIMRSLPEATHYQVITFADKVTYPLGSNYKGKWLLYDPKHSPDFVVTQMRKLKPQGGTSMYPAFEEAFQYKIGGLDTIYLISDGLPDPPDEDIPPAIRKLTPTQQSAYFCNEVRQQLKTVWNTPVKGKTPVRINAIGFYFDSPEVGAFLWALSRDNDGNFVGMSKP